MMMKLTLMKRFFDTVDEEWRSPIADEIAAMWLGREKTVRVLRASANFVARVDHAERKYFLRFNHSNERTTEFIKAELRYIRYLAGQGIRANKPVRSLSGRYVESVSTEMGVFHAVLFEASEGVQRELADLDLDGFERWGRALEEVHEASVGYRDPAIPAWTDEAATVRRILPETEEVILRELEAVEERLKALQVNDGNFGVVHYDFELDNLLWEDGVVSVIDFDDCVRHWFVMDFACALQDLFDEHSGGFDVTEERFAAFLRGYRSVRMMPDEEIALIPLFVRLDHIYVYARLYRSILEGPMPGEPNWTTDLRDKLRKVNEAYLRDIADNPI
jgi:Ser/Thr protein kinase RdoA (MazF antagonist)